MKFISFVFFVITFSAIFSTMTTAQQPTVEYKLGMSKPWTHLLEVEVSFSRLPATSPTFDVAIPAWRTGRYVMFDFSGGVQEFSALDENNKPLSWQKIDKSTWQIEKRHATKVTARYRVYANEFNSRTRGLNDQHAFVDGCAVFMYNEAYKHLPLTLTVTPYKDWHVTTGLDAMKGERLKFTAPNFDYLADCPLEIGNQKDFEFDVEGKKHVLSIFGSGNFTADTLIKDISNIIKTAKEFWGVLPYEHYLFLLHVTPSAGGGTEHMNSTIMGERPFIFKNPKTYEGFLGLVSHEYFHTWNVKQLRPYGIHPYDYTKENYLKELWIAEGTTSYYGGLLLVRAGFITAKKYVEGLAPNVEGDRNRPGNKLQSLSESSYDAWVKYWKNNQQAYNSEADYYDKGSDVSLLLDLEIRQRSENKHSLDDAMRTLYKRFPLKGKKGYTVDDLQKIAEELGGGSFKEFFDTYVHGTTPIAWELYLGYAGLELTAKESERKSWLGAVTSDNGGSTRIVRLIAGSPAEAAGLDPGDEIVAMDGYRVRTDDLKDRVAQLNAGDTIKLTVFRDNQLREFEVHLRLQDIPPYKIAKVGNPSKLQKAIYESWLGAVWEETKDKK
ncbi:MAG: M61 family metallopeptidase [Ignavibacteriales bacterium]|nr:M61 family metallopeptidase [Ignavibacteriales bacterium]